MERITIIGLGLIGGSLGLALKKVKGKDVEIVGYARRKEVAEAALQIGAIDEAAYTLPGSVERSRIVVIATPVMAVKEVFQQIASRLPSECLVTDTASTKTSVMEWAEAYLPSNVSFIGGHPMAGKEVSGLEGAESDLFQGCVYCLVPSPRATLGEAQELEQWIRLIGAKPAIMMDAAEHDRYVGGVSHLPMVLSAALVSAITKSRHWREMSRLAASGFRDLTRLASGNPEINRDICLTNRASIVRWIHEYIEELKEYERLILKGSADLGKVFTRARDARGKWLKSQPAKTSESPFCEK